jgi:PAS domain S-box-containing protein
MTANKKKLPTKRSKYRTADIEDIEFKQLFDDMNESVAVIDPKDASFVYVNKSFVKQVGYSRKEIDNMHVMDLHLNYNSISLWKKHVAVLKKRKLLIDTASFRGKRGDVRNIEVRLKYIGGKPGRVIAVIRDVTDQTNIEKELTSISCFPEENPNPVLRLDKDMKVLYTNSAFKTLLKRYRCPIKSMFRILPKEFKRLIKKTLRDDMVIRNIHAVNRGDIYSYDITPVIDKNYVNIYGSNITTQERALEDIKAMASEWYRTFDAIEDLVFIQDVNYNIVRANKAFFKFIKKKPKEIIGKKCYSILHKRKSPWLNCPFEKTRKDNKYHSEEVDDSIIGMPILVSTSPIKDDSGKLLGSVHIAKDISKFKESEEKLRNSEEKYRTLYDSSDDAIMILDPKSIKFLSANPATIRLFKCTSEKEFLSHTVMSFSPKIQPDGSKTALKAKEMIKSVLKSGSQYFEWRHKKIDGEEFDASVLLNKVKYMGDIVLLATVRDITQEKSDAREILRAKEYAKLIFDFAPSAIFTVDKKRIVRSWNKKAEELTGYTAQETIGKQCMLFAVTPCSEICGLFSKNPNVPIKSRECSIRSKSGDIIIARKHADYLYDGNNEIVGGIESFENITDIKNAEMELRRSEERFKQVAESAEEWIWEVDMNGLYTYSSSMVGSILGYKADEVVGKMHFYDFFDAERRDEIAKSIFDGIKKREVFRGFVNKNTHKNGNTVWLSSTATPILDDEDNLIGYRGADTDVTDRISAEETAERHFIEMEQMNDKIRNTLNVIQEKDQNIHDKNEELSKAYDKLAVVLDKTNLQKELFSDEKDRFGLRPYSWTV